MDFGWSNEEDELYTRVLPFARDVLSRDARRRIAERRFSVDLWRQCGRFGLLGLCVPERYGGLGLSSVATARAVEAFGRGCIDMGLVFSACAHTFAAVMPIVDNGSPALRERLVGPLARGERIGANAITEAEAGSDVFALKTRAVPDGDGYRITGEKSYVTNGPAADVFVVYASTNPGHGYLGISAFAVERDTPGLTVGERFHTAGLRTSPIASVYLDDCRVPATSRIGAEGEGARIFTASMQWERSCLFAAYVGAMERQLEEIVAHVASRRQFRRPLGAFQGVSHRVADMKLRLESARLLLYRACWRRDRGEAAALDVSLAKLAISEAAIRAGLDAIQLHGGGGFMVETGVPDALLDALPSAIFSGTSEIQRDVIARELGL